MNNFKKNIYRLNSNNCNLQPLSVFTTNPTNQEGNNGTATITYSGNQGDLSYNLNGGNYIQITTLNTFTITGLNSFTDYTVIVKENLEQTCQTLITFQLGQSSFYFDADYIMLTYEFTDGTDLDTKTRIAIPNIGQDTPNEYLGYLAGGPVMQYPPTPSTPILTFGGDNTGQGFESVLIDIKEFERLYYRPEANPPVESFTLDCRCLWYQVNSIGIQDVVVKAKLWKGGTPVKNSCSFTDINGIVHHFCWSNTTSLVRDLNSVPVKISGTGEGIDRVSGQRAATLTYNLTTKKGFLNSNDTTTPVV